MKNALFGILLSFISLTAFASTSTYHLAVKDNMGNVIYKTTLTSTPNPKLPANATVYLTSEDKQDYIPSFQSIDGKNVLVKQPGETFYNFGMFVNEDKVDFSMNVFYKFIETVSYNGDTLNIPAHESVDFHNKGILKSGESVSFTFPLGDLIVALSKD